MHKTHSVVISAGLAMLLGARIAVSAPAAPTTQPGVAAPTSQPALLGPTTEPAAPATQPAAAPATQPVAATQPADARAAAEERHKHLDPRWRQINEGQRKSNRALWADATIVQTFKPGALVSLSLTNGQLKVDSTDLTTAVAVRVAVEGSQAVWMLARPRVFVPVGAGVPAAAGHYITLTRFDFDAREGEIWQSHLFVNNRSMTLTATSLYGNTSLTQLNGTITLRVSEYAQVGQLPLNIFTGKAATLMAFRDLHPEEFRLYVLPLLAKFGDTSFLQLGAADVYSVFGEIPADQKVAQELNQLVPQLDVDDPADREAASVKLRQLGAPAALAALRLDTDALSEEQKLRVKAFVANYRRRPNLDPNVERHNLSFLIDCLEFEDVAIRSAAKAELENQAHATVDFDPALTGEDAARAADALRKQLLAPPPPAAPSSVPATQAAPQV